MKAILVILVSAGIAFGQSHSTYSVSVTASSRVAVGFGGMMDDLFYFASDSDRNLLIGGRYAPRLSPWTQPAVAKCLPNGQTLWQNVWSTDTLSDEHFNQILYNPQDNSVIAASESVNPLAHSLIAKFDGNDGHIIWQIQREVFYMYYLSLWRDKVLAVRGGNNATVFIISEKDGTIESSFPVNSYVSGNITMRTLGDTLWVFADEFTAKFLLPSGQLIWKIPTAAAKPVETYGDIDSDGNAYVGVSDGDGKLDSHGWLTIYYTAVKYSSAGEMLWKTQWYGWDSLSDNLNNWIDGVSVDKHWGLVAIYGETNKIGEPGNTGDQSAYIALLRMDNGDTLWTNKWDDDLNPSAILTQWQYGGFNQAHQLVLLAMSYPNAKGAISNFIKTFNVSVIDGIDQKPPVAQNFSLSQNYPNPFSPSTRIEYGVDRREHVTLTVYDVLGRKVATLVDGVQSISEHQVIFDGSRLSSGTYFYKLEAGGKIETKKMMLVK